MIFVIDGVDASGKTTLARCMADKLDCTYVHHTYDSDWTQRQLFEHHLSFLMYYSKDKHLVIDRSWSSCVIYGRVFRGNGDEINAALIERLLITLGCVQIFAIPERILWQEKFEEMCEEREEMYAGKLKEMIAVYDGYFKLCCGNLSGNTHGDYGHGIANSGGMLSIRPNCYKYDMHRQDMEKFADDQIKKDRNSWAE